MHNHIRWFRAAACGLALFFSAVVALGQELYARVVDVGAGLCVVIKAPGPGGKDYFMIYDTGNFVDKGASAMAAIRELVDEDSTIELLILSHSDGDHVAATPQIIDEYHVKQSIHPGIERDRDFWNASLAAIRRESRRGGKNWNLSSKKITPGTSFQIGDATATIVAGLARPLPAWGLTDQGEIMNAGSIIVRITYADRSILLCGDAVGRHKGDPDNACIAMEKFLVDNAMNVTIDSDVVVAPHHGADNGSSKAFIEAVSPTYVIFSAGHKHQHPTKAAAERYLNAGVQIGNMFRTDRGDHEKGVYEWAHERKTNHRDPIGDDDVEIVITADKQVSVNYVTP